MKNISVDVLIISFRFEANGFDACFSKSFEFSLVGGSIPVKILPDSEIAKSVVVRVQNTILVGIEG